MASKYFTWTKGDRKHAAEALRTGGVVPIPVECISIKGLDYARTTKGSSKASRKPGPLTLDSSPETLGYARRTDNTIALHDAAVQSATTLFGVMNDMLRSPHVSAHLQQRASTLRPMYGRPRSHTAPSTPLVEAPFQEPVELPGSLLAGQKSYTSLHQSMDGTNLTLFPNAVLGYTIERPHTSPQESTHPSPMYQRASTDEAPPLPLRPYQPPFSPDDIGKSRAIEVPHPAGEEDTLVASEGATWSSRMKRPSLSVLQSWQPKPSAPSALQASSQGGTFLAIPQPTWAGSTDSLPREDMQQLDAEAALMDQISTIRASHEAHLASLKEAHEREVASQRSYIMFLEQRRGFVSRTVPSDSKQGLTIDTDQASKSHAEPLPSDASATTLQSFEHSLENKRRTSQEAVAEAESLKRKLSLFRKAQTDSGEVRRERDQFRDAVDRSDRRILQLKDIVRKAKENEKSLRNAVEDLQTRLTTANNERMDVREGFHEACNHVRRLTQREAALIKNVKDMRGRLAYTNASFTSLASTNSDQTHDKSKHSRAKSDMNLQVWNHDPLLAQVRQLRQSNGEKEGRVQQLERQLHQERQISETNRTRVLELQAAEEMAQQALSTVEQDRDKYNRLLQNELRRQTRQATQSTHAATPQIETEAQQTTEERLSRVRADSLLENKDQVAMLEKELQYCIKEIIMYKLDVRGYKKDLKRAHTDLEDLRSAKVKMPPTPERDSTSSIASQSSTDQRRPSRADMRHRSDSSGLGITLAQPPKTPTRTIASATLEALMSTTPPPAFLSSPPPRSKTPLSTHKRLPRPPVSRTPSPLPTYSPPIQKLRQQDTPRSLSESIISSYAKRSTPEQGGLATPERGGIISSRNTEVS